MAMQDRQARAAEVAMGMHDEHMAELQAALEAAQARATAAEEHAASLHARLEREAELRAHAQADLAAERAAREGVVAQLTQARETSTSLNARLEQAIAAGAEREPAKPWTYEIDMSNRDLNGRANRMLLKPVKEG